MPEVIHRQLTSEERRAVSEAASNGAAFDRPEMWCRTGDGHAKGVEVWSAVTCPRCLEARPNANKIAKSERAHLSAPRPAYEDFSTIMQRVAREPGELLTMEGGEQWFHPFGGGAPVKIDDINRKRLEV